MPASLHAVLPELPWPEGRIPVPGGSVGFRVVRRGGSLCQVVFEREEGGPDPQVALDWAADAGCPVVGDVDRGGVSAGGGVRLAVGPEAPADLWPAASVFAPDASAPGGGAVLRVSPGSLKALRRGHPWVLSDAETGDTLRFAPGALVRVAGRHGATAALARIDDARPVAARVWAVGDVRPRDAPSVEARVARALARRAKLGAETEALRLVHGEADALPGIAVDRLGSLLRVLVTGRAPLAILDRTLDALGRQLGPLATVQVMHLRETPPGELRRVQQVRGDVAPPARVRVEEAGLRFWVAPGHDEPMRSRPGVGLFLDQRRGRALLRQRARPDGRYLNLFAHTGAYSVALLAAGAAQVTSVDLSAAYLGWLDENLEANDLGPANADHQSVRLDVRRYLGGLDPEVRFDGIVLDPPTAASAGRRFFSARRELPEMVAQCLDRLAPGGWLLVSRHDRRHRGRLETLVREAGAGCEVRFERIRPPEDFPALEGFPEGDPFEGLLVHRV